MRLYEPADVPRSRRERIALRLLLALAGVALIACAIVLYSTVVSSASNDAEPPPAVTADGEVVTVLTAKTADGSVFVVQAFRTADKQLCVRVGQDSGRDNSNVCFRFDGEVPGRVYGVAQVGVGSQQVVVAPLGPGVHDAVVRHGTASSTVAPVRLSDGDRAHLGFRGDVSFAVSVGARSDGDVSVATNGPSGDSASIPPAPPQG